MYVTIFGYPAFREKTLIVLDLRRSSKDGDFVQFETKEGAICDREAYSSENMDKSRHMKPNDEHMLITNENHPIKNQNHSDEQVCFFILEYRHG